MSDLALKNLTIATMVVLIANAVFEVFSGIFGGFFGISGACVATAISIYCGWMARRGADQVGWFLVPTFLFTVLPLVASVWKFLTDDKAGLLDRIQEHFPIIIGFVAPMALLGLIYNELRKRP